MDISSFLIPLAALASIIWVWLNTLASIAIRCDKDLEPFQRVAQFIFVWVVPYVGASIVLRIVYEHSPNTIPRKWIPWPFKNLIYWPLIKSNPLRDDREPEDGKVKNNSAGTDFSSDGGGD